MAVRRPAEVFPPGDFIREELEDRGWTQADLADILGRPTRLVNEIIMGKRGITPETAKGLAAAFGSSPEYWMNLESSYQLWRDHDDDTGEDNASVVARRASIYEKAPIKEMVRRGWIEKTTAADAIEAQYCAFFELGSLEEPPVFFPYAARRSSPYGDHGPAMLAWLFQARKLARTLAAAEYSTASLDRVLGELRSLRRSPQDAHLVFQVLREAGVRFVVVQALPGTRIDGACFWLDDRSPVVAMSIRFDRIDNFWFTLMHELGHVRAHDGSVDTDLVASVGRDDRQPEEIKADEFACEQLIPSAALDEFARRTRPFYSTARILSFSEERGVHPGLVVGQLQHRQEISWSAFRRTLEPIREDVTATALTDGWGMVPQLTLATPGEGSRA